jgi:hypothetical protein
MFFCDASSNPVQRLLLYCFIASFCVSVVVETRNNFIFGPCR